MISKPDSPEALERAGDAAWCVRAFRELDAALLDLRFNRPLVGTVAIETTGDANAVLAVDAMLAKYKDHGLVNEVRLFIRRTLKRMDVTAKTFFAVVAPGSSFAGTLLELALASDRIYMKDEDGVALHVSEMNAGAFPMGNGLTRLQSRFLKEPERVNQLVHQCSYTTIGLAEQPRDPNTLLFRHRSRQSPRVTRWRWHPVGSTRNPA